MEYFICKILIVGDGNVGKTALRQRYLGGTFVSSYFRTVGADFGIKYINLNLNEQQFNIKAQLWDLSGQPHFSSVRPMFYKGGHGFILVFDITNHESLENLENWILEAEKVIKIADLPIIILGNKIDLKTTINETSFEQDCEKTANDLSERIFGQKGKIKYYFTSALTGEMVDKAFDEMGTLIIEKFLLNK
ncbi:MAG: GTP-binding protein [Candidatus Thorarchaeota archaeon]